MNNLMYEDLLRRARHYNSFQPPVVVGELISAVQVLHRELRRAEDDLGALAAVCDAVVRIHEMSDADLNELRDRASAVARRPSLQE